MNGRVLYCDMWKEIAQEMIQLTNINYTTNNVLFMNYFLVLNFHFDAESKKF